MDSVGNESAAARPQAGGQTVSLLTDLGEGSDIIGAVRGVLGDLAPQVRVIDLTHSVDSYDVRGGSLALARAIGYVPAGVVIAAVDAATDRPHVAIEVAGGAGVLIGPDNGVLAPAVALAGGADRAVVLDDPTRHLVSPGGLLAVRDVYAPVAAALCNGADLADLGSAVAVEALLPGVIPLPRESPDGSVVAEVLWVNRMGDCQLNIGADDLGGLDGQPGRHRLEVRVGSGDDATVRVAEWVTHVSTLSTGAIGAMVDPHGMVALVQSRRSAAADLDLAVGDQVTVRVVQGDVTASPVAPPSIRRRAD